MLLPGRHRPGLRTEAGPDHAHRDAHRYQHPNRHQLCDRDHHADRDGHRHCVAYGLADRYADHNPHTVHPAYVNLYGLAYSDAYSHPNPYTDRYADVHPVADRYAHTYNHSIPDFPSYTMTDILPFLKSLISAPGVSAYEAPVVRLIEEKWKPLVDELSTSRLGSLHGLKRGRSGGKHPSIMLAAHMDAIGLIVTRIDDGLLYVDDIGGVDPRILPGTPVIVHGKQQLPGVVVLPPLKTLPESHRDGAVGLHNLLVDVGLTAPNVKRLVHVGDTVSFDTQPVELGGEVISGHSLDNRASVAALTVCLENLQGSEHKWDVWAVATSQEEETLGGAATSAFQLQPDLAVAIDVTFAKGPGANGWQTFGLGKGPTLGWGANLHPFLFDRFKELADRLEIPVSTDLTPGHSGTDAYAIQVAREGIPTIVLGIPLRYMHTPVEMVAVKDVLRAGRLLAEFICGLAPDFVSKIVWEEEQSAE